MDAAVFVKQRYDHNEAAKRFAKRRVVRRVEKRETELGIGSSLLRKMGWEGGGLGRDGAGCVRPIEVEGREKGAGLGFKPALPKPLKVAKTHNSRKAAASAATECPECGALIHGTRKAREHMKREHRRRRKRPRAEEEDEDEDDAEVPQAENLPVPQRRRRVGLKAASKPFQAPRRLTQPQ